MKYAVRIFEDYLKVINTDLVTVSALPNSELDSVLEVSCRCETERWDLALD